LKSIYSACLLTLFATTASAVQATDSPATAATSQGDSRICVVAGTPPAPAQYTVIKQLKIGKGSYGSVDDAIAMMVVKARKSGADAVINYTGSQRFGFWPWRFVRPVVRGTAVKWSAGSTFDCVASGGSLH
jgi:hypothetical protein